QFGATLDAAEGAAAPDATGDQLERTGADLLPRAGDADDHRLAPALVRTLQRGAHQLHVAHAFEAVVHATIGHLDDDLLDRLVVILRVDEIGGAQLLGDGELRRGEVDGDDAAGAPHPRGAERRRPGA